MNPPRSGSGLGSGASEDLLGRIVRWGASLFLAGTVTELAWTLFAGAAPGWRREDHHEVAELEVDPTGAPGFRWVSPERSGVTFTNLLPIANLVTNTVYHNGSGVALGDVDGDGWCDIYLGRLLGKNRLYRNLGDWRFADITVEAGVGC